MLLTEKENCLRLMPSRSPDPRRFATLWPGTGSGKQEGDVWPVSDAKSPSTAHRASRRASRELSAWIDNSIKDRNCVRSLELAAKDRDGAMKILIRQRVVDPARHSCWSLLAFYILKHKRCPGPLVSHSQLMQVSSIKKIGLEIPGIFLSKRIMSLKCGQL